MNNENKPISPVVAGLLGAIFAMQDTHAARVSDVSPVGYICSVCRQESGHAPECRKPRGLIKIGVKP